MNEQEIIRRCISRDEEAFRMLVDRYSEFAFSVAFRILNDEEESRDMVQEAFITAWYKIGQFRKGKSFNSWLYRIVVNKCYDSLRRSKRATMVHPDDYHWNLPGMLSENNVETELGNKEIAGIIRRLTRELSPKQKVVFILSELEGLSHADISGITGMAVTSVKSNLHHARRNIGKMIEKYI